MSTRICASIATEKVSDGILLTRKGELMGADLIEIRLDYLKDLRGIRKIVESTSLPLIATNRLYEQGGRRAQREDKRLRELLNAANLGFQYVDVELKAALDSFIRELKEIGARIIISFHDFKRTPSLSELEKITNLQVKAGADVCKVVTTANEIADNIPLLLHTSKTSKTAKLVCFAMGEKGTLSRVLSPMFGAFCTYASVKKGLETAPGQLTISKLKELYESLGVEN